MSDDEKDGLTLAKIAQARKRLMIDLDGVLFPYSRGYQDGSFYEPPMPGAVEALQTLAKQGFTYMVFTTRMTITDNQSKQKNEILAWLHRHKFPVPEDVTNIKHPALAYIDDRAMRFTGWPDLRKYWT